MHKLTLTISILLFSILSISVKAEKDIKINFMTEAQGFRLLEIAEDSSILKKLKEVNAEIYVGITDFSTERVKALKIFAKHNIQCHAWLLLSKGEGYFPNAHNGESYLQRFESFNNWSRKNGLQWNSLTVSQAPYKTDQRIIQNGSLSIMKVILKRLISGSVQQQGDINYARLRSVSQKEGFVTNSVITPYQIDGREVNVDTWKQISGTFNMLNDEEYLSVFNHYEENTVKTLAQIKAYQSGFKNIIVGSANPTKPLSNEENPRPLQWKELTQYVTLVRQYDKNLVIYGLDGAIKNDILKNLSLHLTDDKLPNLKAAEEIIRKERENTQALFTILAHPGWIVSFFLVLAITLMIASLRTLKLIF
ncbi:MULTISPECIES: hypothetical protein [Flammeovirga]|uniref:Uncharacterized protein n=1 Tax=Flammeovirga agarivorans TaxID=2726742 RepID=A0A7X8SL44_9BACT|nr:MULTISPECIES: hypothetical protein [Flammeovirga]NLR92244.1 hypothetical protein [Flammeovirga agarivorans]